MGARGPNESGSLPDADESALLEGARNGDAASRNELLSRYQKRLIRMVEFRISPALARRVDAADIVQDALLAAARRLEEYFNNSNMDFYVWLRWLTKDRLTDAQRQHFGAARRDANREVHADSVLSRHSALQLADVLAGHLTSPSRAAAREEQKAAIQAGLNSMDEQDREILILRHFEQLSLEEAAQCLSISKSGANKRHLKALRELKRRLGKLAE